FEKSDFHRLWNPKGSLRSPKIVSSGKPRNRSVSVRWTRAYSACDRSASPINSWKARSPSRSMAQRNARRPVGSRLRPASTDVAGIRGNRPVATSKSRTSGLAMSASIARNRNSRGAPGECVRGDDSAHPLGNFGDPGEPRQATQIVNDEDKLLQLQLGDNLRRMVQVDP